MKIIEPLNLKIRQFLARDAPNPLSAARTQYGSREDYRFLGNLLIEVLASYDGILAVDFFPFDRVGNRPAFKEFIISLKDLSRIIFIAGTGDFSEFLTYHQRSDERISVLVMDESACAVSGHGGALGTANLHWLRDLVEARRSLAEVRKPVVNQMLFSWIRETLITSESRPVPQKDVVTLDGRRYIRMQTGMVVSSYVNMKAILADPDRLVDLAVEVCWQLFDDFRRDTIRKPPDWIVTPNNTSVQLGAAVQAIAHAPLAVIDHIGPVPAFGIVAQRVSTDLRGCEVTLLTDVSATGGEIDRSVLFLHGLGARIREVICPVWLEVGRCQLTSGIPFVALCTPKRELQYEYRSE